MNRLGPEVEASPESPQSFTYASGVAGGNEGSAGSPCNEPTVAACVRSAGRNAID